MIGTDLQLAPEVQVHSVDSKWSFQDYLGSIKTRSSLARNNYMVKPGLYRIGNPDGDSEVLVSANYKLSFDVLRRSLEGLDVWILVLDTKGVNVWCAAGKGTFGTEELSNQIKTTSLASRVNHHRLIVPQLGAPGVSAHKIKEATGFNVKYGPVRAEDLPAYLNSGNKATKEMRAVKFNLLDRLILTPVEIVYSFKYLLLASLFVFLLSAFDKHGFNASLFLTEGIPNALTMALAFLSGTFFGPTLLPVLPFRSLSLKGVFSGAIIWTIPFFSFLNGNFGLKSLAFFLLFIALGSFFTMNFTGATTYTSLSGVKKEMKYSLPIQIGVGALGIILFIISRFI